MGTRDKGPRPTVFENGYTRDIQRHIDRLVCRGPAGSDMESTIGRHVEGPFYRALSICGTVNSASCHDTLPPSSCLFASAF